MSGFESMTELVRIAKTSREEASFVMGLESQNTLPSFFFFFKGGKGGFVGFLRFVLLVL